MACSSCSSTCNCAVVAANTSITVSGTGTAANPYQLSTDVCASLKGLTNTGRAIVFATDKVPVVNGSNTCELVTITAGLNGAQGPQGPQGPTGTGTSGVAYASVSTTQATFTNTATNLTGLTVTWTAVAGRAYAVTATCIMNSSASGDIASLMLMAGTLQLARSTRNLVNDGATIINYDFHISFQYRPTLTNTTTFKLMGIRDAGTGNISAPGNAFGPALLQVLDIGPAV